MNHLKMLNDLHQFAPIEEQALIAALIPLIEKNASRVVIDAFFRRALAAVVTLEQFMSEYQPNVELQDVLLVDPGAKRVSVVKVIRSLTGLPLKEAVDFTRSEVYPVVVLKGVPIDVAEAAVQQLIEQGATAQVRAA
jgi:ribosomal protein L7/L12